MIIVRYTWFQTKLQYKVGSGRGTLLEGEYFKFNLREQYVGLV